jgi:hypothetical protein
MRKLLLTIFSITLGLALAMPALAVDDTTGASIAFGSPSPSSISVNTVFEISVNLTTGNNEIDEIDLRINFPKDKLQIESAGIIKGTAFPTGSEPNQTSIDTANEEGRIEFDVTRSTNLTANGEAAKFRFKAMAPGSALLHFDTSSSTGTIAFATDVGVTDATLTIAGTAATPTTAATFAVQATPTLVAGTQKGPSNLSGTGPEDI